MTEYKEMMVEYDIDEGVVYVSGLDDDDFWTELQVVTEEDSDMADAESYAWGVHDAYKQMDRFVSIVNITGYLEDEDIEMLDGEDDLVE